jgi:hypothetical protein
LDSRGLPRWGQDEREARVSQRQPAAAFAQAACCRSQFT